MIVVTGAVEMRLKYAWAAVDSAGMILIRSCLAARIGRGGQNPLNKLVLRLLRKAGIMGRDEFFNPAETKTLVIFIFAQLVFTIVTMTPVWFCYNFFVFHTVFMTAVFGFCIWNGASYYIEGA